MKEFNLWTATREFIRENGTEYYQLEYRTEYDSQDTYEVYECKVSSNNKAIIITGTIKEINHHFSI